MGKYFTKPCLTGVLLLTYYGKTDSTMEKTSRTCDYPPQPQVGCGHMAILPQPY